MRKSKLIVSVASAAAFGVAGLGLSGSASAASIEMTGPGSTNVIYANHRSGDGSIYMTGPDSRNIIRSDYGGNQHYYQNMDWNRDKGCNYSHNNWYYMKADYKKHDHRNDHDVDDAGQAHSRNDTIEREHHINNNDLRHYCTKRGFSRIALIHAFISFEFMMDFFYGFI